VIIGYEMGEDHLWITCAIFFRLVHKTVHICTDKCSLL